MRLLIVGSGGQLGRELELQAVGRGHEVKGCDLPEMDITAAASVRSVVGAFAPDVIVNCAAFTDVDGAESDEALATEVNGAAVGNLAAAADEAGVRLVQISTDYVFDGRSTRPYREGDLANPLSAYGRSKLRGEEMALGARHGLVVRTAWLFGVGGANFVEAIRRQLQGGKRELTVVDDQRGSPTYAGDLAWAVLELLGVGAEGIVHAVNSGETSWHGFAREIASRLEIQVDIRAGTTAELGRPAPRPRYSVLSTERLARMLGRELPPWQDALGRYLSR